ncbi:MAG: hypothetical protein OEZ16_00835 [Chromatiales bacterium]|nr:hypothetical protein [Chromatiales bacterium]
MYAVIFRAEINIIDESYTDTAIRMRGLAKTRYGCTEFISFLEDNQELSISYWKSEEQIAAWKNDPEHLAAQTMGRTKWYKSYKIEVVKIEREYSHVS